MDYGCGAKAKKSTFSEYGHVVYQIKGNEMYKIRANTFPLHTHLAQGVESKGQKSFFSESDQIKGNEVSNMLANSLPIQTLSVPGMVSKGQNIFSEGCHVAYQINGNEMYKIQANILSLRTPLTPGCGQKVNIFF